MEQNIFFVSDTHFMHNKEFLYTPRGFKTIEEHDKTIIKNWNEVVKENDIVYHMGDVYMGADHTRAKELVSQLNGHIKFVRGNHDTDNKVETLESLGWECLGWANMIKIHKQHLYLSHYPTMTSNLEKSTNLKEHTICVCGHTHAKSKFYQEMPFIVNVAADAWNNRPVQYEIMIATIKSEIQNLEQYLLD